MNNGLKAFVILVTLFLQCTLSIAQKGNVQGTIREKDTQQPLSFVNSVNQITQLGTSTDESGNYRVSNIQTGEYKIRFSSIGSKTITKISHFPIKNRFSPKLVYFLHKGISFLSSYARDRDIIQM